MIFINFNKRFDAFGAMGCADFLNSLTFYVCLHLPSDGERIDFRTFAQGCQCRKSLDPEQTGASGKRHEVDVTCNDEACLASLYGLCGFACLACLACLASLM